MSCCGNGAVNCGIKGSVEQDCIECKWVVFGQTSQVIYEANEIVSASGSIEESSRTTGMTQITITFSIGGTEITHFTLSDRQSLAFTVVGFDTVTLKGHGLAPLDSASGRFCITPRYTVF